MTLCHFLKTERPSSSFLFLKFFFIVQHICSTLTLKGRNGYQLETVRRLSSKRPCSCFRHIITKIKIQSQLHTPAGTVWWWGRGGGGCLLKISNSSSRSGSTAFVTQATGLNNASSFSGRKEITADKESIFTCGCGTSCTMLHARVGDRADLCMCHVCEKSQLFIFSSLC